MSCIEVDDDEAINNDEQDLIENVTEGAQFKSFPQRWFILLVVVILNISSGLTWLTFSPIADKAGEFYQTDSDHINWLSLVFPIATIPFGVTATWFLDTFGIRKGIILSAWINAIGCGIRVLSTLEVFMDWSFTFVIIGQTLAAIAQPFILFMPPKVAGIWFPSNQRAIATTIGSMANPLGILLANVLSPLIMKHLASNMPLLLEIYLLPAAFGAVLATFGICSAQPPTPPSSSASHQQTPSFFIGLKETLKNKNYVILAICQGSGVAAFTTVTTLLQQMLCPQNYTDRFAGYCGAAIIGVGIVGSAVAGIIVDKTKKFEEVTKICFSVATVFFIVFSILSRYEDVGIYIALSLSLFGFFGLAAYPLALELAIECTYPVAEATSAGIILIAGQILSIVFIICLQTIAKPFADPETECFPEVPQNFTIANVILCGVMTLFATIFTSGFHCKYLRLHSEQQENDSMVSFSHNINT